MNIRSKLAEVYATTGDKKIGKAMRDVAHGTLRYHRGVRRRLVTNARRVNDKIDSWFPEETLTDVDTSDIPPLKGVKRSMRNRIIATGLKVLATPFYLVYTALEAAAAAVVTAAAVVIEAALATVRAVGAVMVTVAYLTATVAGAILWLAAVILAAATLLVLALVALAAIVVSFVAFLLDHLGRALSPAPMPSVQAVVETYWGEDDEAPVEPSARERTSRLHPVGGAA